MSGLARRVRAERDLWRAVWQQVEAFLDRIDSTAEQDSQHVRALAVLLPVFDVIERARRRAKGYGLSAALPVSPRGVGRPNLGGNVFDAARVPGAEECELAVAAYVVPDGSDEPSLGDDPPTLLHRSVVLAHFRDDKHAGDVALVVPAYDFGPLGGPALVLGAAKQGLFPMKQRGKAIEADPDDPFRFTAWSALRSKRVDDLRDHHDDTTSPSLSSKLNQLPLGAPLAEYAAIGNGAAAAAGECRRDRVVLETARTTLTADGADDVLLGRLQAAGDRLATQATSYDWVASHLLGRSLAQILPERSTIYSHLVQADQPGGDGIAIELRRVDTSACETLDVEVEARIGYPDGPLRMLRLLEQTLRFFWNARSLWMARRHALLTRPLLDRFFAPFVDSLVKIRAGHGSGLALPAGAHTTALAHVQATELKVSAAIPPAINPLGRLAYVGGDRPTAAVVLDALGGGARLATTALAISVEAGAQLKGLPGAIAAGAPVGANFPAITDAELRRGTSAHGREADGVIEALVVHATRLQLVLGGPGGTKDRPDAPSVPAPYGSRTFELIAPVAPAATRLFLTALPPAASSGDGTLLPAARRGELILIRGADDDDQFWQVVVEVDRCEVVKGAQARADDAVSDTATPPCCADDEPVMIVYVRAMQLPGDVTLTRAITLHRDFRGFGYRSLLARAVLPVELDPATATVTVHDGGHDRTVLRDPELKAAVRVFEDWLGPDARVDAMSRDDLYALVTLLGDLDRVINPLPRVEVGRYTLDPNLPPPLPPVASGGGRAGPGPSSPPGRRANPRAGASAEAVTRGGARAARATEAAPIAGAVATRGVVAPPPTAAARAARGAEVEPARSAAVVHGSEPRPAAPTRAPRPTGASEPATTRAPQSPAAPTARETVVRSTIADEPRGAPRRPTLPAPAASAPRRAAGRRLRAPPGAIARAPTAPSIDAAPTAIRRPPAPPRSHARAAGPADRDAPIAPSAAAPRTTAPTPPRAPSRRRASHRDPAGSPRAHAAEHPVSGQLTPPPAGLDAPRGDRPRAPSAIAPPPLPGSRAPLDDRLAAAPASPPALPRGADRIARAPRVEPPAPPPPEPSWLAALDDDDDDLPAIAAPPPRQVCIAGRWVTIDPAILRRPQARLGLARRRGRRW